MQRKYSARARGENKPDNISDAVQKKWDAPGPDADADEKAADEDKMLKQVFATKNGMQAEQELELEQGSFLFLQQFLHFLSAIRTF